MSGSLVLCLEPDDWIPWRVSGADEAGGELMEGTPGSLDSLKGVPLHLALDNTGVGLIACDASGMLTLISPALQELFGMEYEPVAEPLYVERFRLFRDDGETELPLDEVPLVRARHGEFVRDALVTTRRADASLVHLRCNAVPLHDDLGDANGAISLVQDVTAETEAAKRAQALQRKLLETINHEFRTPLAALLGHVELIHDHRDRRDDLDPELATWLDAIERAGWRLRDLVEEVSDLVSYDDPAEADPTTRRMRAV
jgi:PAS domain S-box-containing protein